MLKRYAVTAGKGFRLRGIDPQDTLGLKEKEARAALAKDVERLDELQEMLYAQDQWGVLLIFQAMDAAGKDGAIEHVMSGVNPQGCQVFSFKAPSAEELDHDFLWRTSKCLPERGRIGIFNRSYYEETLVVRVHPPILAGQHLPKELVTKSIWEERLEDIAAFERYFARQGYLILKFFLHVSKEEQKERFLARLDEPEKNWKFALGDVRERAHWDEYQKAYETTIRATAAPHAPWFVVPADHKWFTRLVDLADPRRGDRRPRPRLAEAGPRPRRPRRGEESSRQGLSAGICATGPNRARIATGLSPGELESRYQGGVNAMMPRSNRLVPILLAAVLGASVSTRLAAQYDGALSLNWGAGDGFATWDGPGASGQVFLETAVATNELLYAVGDYDFPAGTRSLHFQAVDRNGEERSDRACHDSTADFGAFTDESGGEAAIIDCLGESADRRLGELHRHALPSPRPGGALRDRPARLHARRGLLDRRLPAVQHPGYCNPESCVIVGPGRDPAGDRRGQRAAHRRPAARHRGDLELPLLPPRPDDRRARSTPPSALRHRHSRDHLGRPRHAAVRRHHDGGRRWAGSSSC